MSNGAAAAAVGMGGFVEGLLGGMERAQDKRASQLENWRKIFSGLAEKYPDDPRIVADALKGYISTMQMSTRIGLGDVARPGKSRQKFQEQQKPLQDIVDHILVLAGGGESLPQQVQQATPPPSVPASGKIGGTGPLAGMERPTDISVRPMPVQTPQATSTPSDGLHVSPVPSSVYVKIKEAEAKMAAIRTQEKAIRADKNLSPEQQDRAILRLHDVLPIGSMMTPHPVGKGPITKAQLPATAVLHDGTPASAAPEGYYSLSEIGNKLVAFPAAAPGAGKTALTPIIVGKLPIGFRGADGTPYYPGMKNIPPDVQEGMNAAFAADKEDRRRRQEDRQQAFAQAWTMAGVHDQFTTNRQAKADLAKYYKDAEAAQMRFRVMENVYQLAQSDVRLTGAADVVLLAMHMGMSVGGIKGMRTGTQLLAWHESARSFLDSAGVHIDSFLTGGRLSPAQRQDFLNLARERAAEESSAYDSANEHWAEMGAKLPETKAPGVGGGVRASLVPFVPPPDAPPAPLQDGHKLKMNGKVIAVSKGGQWAAPSSQ